MPHNRTSILSIRETAQTGYPWSRPRVSLSICLSAPAQPFSRNLPCGRDGVGTFTRAPSYAPCKFPSEILRTLVAMLGLVVASTGLQLPTANQAPSTRRALLSSTAAVAALALPAASFAAVKPCPGGANNCFSTAGPDKAKVTQWVWPSGMSRADATASLKSVLVAYPQAGQDGVDGGGWTLTTDTLVDNSFAAFEFKSAGTGNFAKFFNGGKPFIDDLEVSVEDTYVRRAPLEYPAGILVCSP